MPCCVQSIRVDQYASLVGRLSAYMRVVTRDTITLGSKTLRCGHLRTECCPYAACWTRYPRWTWMFGLRCDVFHPLSWRRHSFHVTATTQKYLLPSTLSEVVPANQYRLTPKLREARRVHQRSMLLCACSRNSLRAVQAYGAFLCRHGAAMLSAYNPDDASDDVLQLRP